MERLFGTDGIRGRANRHPMTPEVATTVGRAVARYFGRDGETTPFVIGRDTRRSGDMIEHAVVAGICSGGGDVRRAGILPTPGVAYLAAAEGAGAGIMISASHNPYIDNGIKLFNGRGFKLTDADEDRIEALARDPDLKSWCEGVEPGRAGSLDDAQDRYVRFLIDAVADGMDLTGMRIVLDASNGATFDVAPRVFAELGASVEALSVSPDGENINDGCGSEHPEGLMERVVRTGATVGLAFDGDGDRLIAVDERGRRVTGDQILAVCAQAAKNRGRLPADTVVSTVMSNIGLRLCLKSMGIRHRMADVGDRYVMAEMLETGAVIGGEDSGHMIFLDHHTTGDGILTALKLISAMKDSGRPLSGLASQVTVYPQVLMNVPVTRKLPISEIPGVSAAIADAEARLGEAGRVLVRYSGTQLLCRVMVEGPTRELTERCCRDIVDVIRSAVGQ